MSNTDTDRLTALELDHAIVSTLAADLHELADWLDRNADRAPAVHTYAGFGPTVAVWCDDAGELAAVTRWLQRGSTVDNPVHKSVNNALVYRERRFGGFTLSAMAGRDAVCRRVEVGTEIVQVPDPNAVVPMISETRPMFEWVCDDDQATS